MPLPATTGALELEKLTSFLVALREDVRDDVRFRGEVAVRFSADPSVPWQTLVAAMDACRYAPDGRPLFPDVILHEAPVH